MEFSKILEKATNDELQKLWNNVMYMDVMLNDDNLFDRASIAFENEIKRRLNNGTMKHKFSDFPTDYEIFVSNCL